MPYLDLQHIITSNSLVVHLVIGIISIPAALVLYKRKPERSTLLGTVLTLHIFDFAVIRFCHLQSTSRGSRSWNVTSDKTPIPSILSELGC